MKKKLFSTYAYILLFVTLIVRVLTVFLIAKVPCMDSQYLDQATRFLNEVGSTSISLTPLYGILLYFLNSVFDSLFLASSICYISFSLSISIIMYLIAKELFNERSAIITLLIMILLPNLTVAVAGYSHTPTVSLALILFSAYILVLWNASKIKTTYCISLFSVSSILAIYTRPESIIIVVALALLSSFNNEVKLRQRLFFTTFSLMLITISVFTHHAIIRQRSNAKYVGAFSDAQYSYHTFMHTLSLRNQTGINDSIAMRLSIQEFGHPEDNDWSISKAVKKNPKATLSLFVFNVKELLDNFAHPLFYPIYLFIFIGGGILSCVDGNNIFHKGLIPVFLISALIPVIVFHVEIRYLANALIPLILLTSYGIDQINDSSRKIKIVTLLLVANLVIFLSYLLTNMKLESLCG